jgi:hypothetical protein
MPRRIVRSRQPCRKWRNANFRRLPKKRRSRWGGSGASRRVWARRHRANERHSRRMVVGTIVRLSVAIRARNREASPLSLLGHQMQWLGYARVRWFRG